MDNESITKETKIYNGVNTVYLINRVGKNWTDICKEMKLDHFFTPHTRKNQNELKTKKP